MWMGSRHRLRRLLSAVAAVATFVVAWLVVTPSAWAAAPLCDPRGAIMFAPPPQIQDPEQSLDVPACDDHAADLLGAKSVVAHRGGPQLDASSSQEPATTAAAVVPLAPPLARVDAPEPRETRPPSGVRSCIERPPRG